MKKQITGEEYARLPVYAHSLYEFKEVDNYVLTTVINHEKFISIMYYTAKDLDYVEFREWFFKNSPVRIIENLQIV